jgi:L-ascorbate metabolism protein UlaG (beta-lactamase superfamily)
MLTLLIALSLGFSTPTPGHAPADSVSITYVGNEGFLIEAGGGKVLIDALYRSGVSGYVVHPPDVRKKLERALPPFDAVDLVLATHYHADHFDPEAVGIHLLSNREALFVSTLQAAGQMEGYKGYRNIQARVLGALLEEGESETVEHNGITVRLLNLHHGRDRPVENLAFIVEMGGRTFLHVGDTEVSPDELAAYDWSKETIDFFFVPYWFLLDEPSGDDIVATVAAATVVPMHIPPPDDPRGYLQGSGGFDGTISRIATNYPAAAIFRDVMTTMTFR